MPGNLELCHPFCEPNPVQIWDGPDSRDEVHYLKKTPVLIRWLPHMLRLRPILKSYLESVIRGFYWYATRGEPVPRDNFNRHPWFSAKSGA